MKNVKKRIASAFLAVLMLLSVTSVAFAAEASKLNITAERQNGQTIVEAFLTGTGVTNGRIEITYDSARVTLISVTPADDSWVTSVDKDTNGLVSFAWVASNINAETKLVTLVFEPVNKASYETYTLAATELYGSGTALALPDEDVAVLAKPNSGSGSGSGGGVDHPFTDIDDHWAEGDIIAAYNAGLVNGTGDGTTFSPDTNLNRAMFATLLYRLAGEPSVSGTHPFTDVPSGQYYSNAVLWAYQNNVITGTGDGTTFSPNDIVTREQMVTMLYRYAKFAGVDTSASASLASFPDHAAVSTWAEAGMKWAVAEGIIQGGSDGKLLPQGYTNRAQAATVLVRFAD